MAQCKFTNFDESRIRDIVRYGAPSEFLTKTMDKVARHMIQYHRFKDVDWENTIVESVYNSLYDTGNIHQAESIEDFSKTYSGPSEGTVYGDVKYSLEDIRTALNKSITKGPEPEVTEEDPTRVITKEKPRLADRPGNAMIDILSASRLQNSAPLTELFTKQFYNSHLVDFQAGTTLSVSNEEAVDEAISSFRSDLKELADDYREEIDEIANMGDPLDAQIAFEDMVDDDPEFEDAYIAALAEANFDDLLHTIFNDAFVNIGTAASPYYTTNVKAETRFGTKMRSSFKTEGDSVEDAFTGLSAVLELHLQNTPLLHFDGSGFTPLGSSTINTMDLKRKIEEHKLSDIGNTQKDIGEAIRKKMDRDPILAGLYARFFSPVPVMINGIETHSFASMGSESRAMTAKTENILNNLISMINNTTMHKYVFAERDLKGNYILDSPKHKSATFSEFESNASGLVEAGRLKKVEVTPQKVTIETPVKKFDIGVKLVDSSTGRLEAQDDISDSYELAALLEAVGIPVQSFNSNGLVSAILSRDTDDSKAGQKLLLDTVVNAATVLKSRQDASQEDFLKGMGYPATKAASVAGNTDRVFLNTPVEGMLSQLIEVADNLSGATSDKTRNLDGDLIVTYGLKSAINNLPQRIAEIKELDNSVLSDNQFVTNELKIKGIFNKLGIKNDETNKDMISASSMANFNISALYAESLTSSNGKSAIFDLFVPADKSRYPAISIEGDNLFPTTIDGKYDKETHREYVFNTLQKAYNAQAKNIQDKWMRVLEENPSLLGKKVLQKSYNFDSFVKLVKGLKLTPAIIKGTELVNNHDWTIGETGVIIRPDLVEVKKVFNNKKYFDTWMDKQLVQTSMALTNQTYSDNPNQGYSGKPLTGMEKMFGDNVTKWANTKSNNTFNKGDLYTTASIETGPDITVENTSYNPVFESYIYNFIAVSNQFMGLHLGNTMSYKIDTRGKKITAEEGSREYFDQIDSYLHDSYIDQSKRAVGLVSTYTRPTLSSTDPITGLPTRGNILAMDTKVAFFNDIEIPLVEKAFGRTVDQEVLDGMFWILPTNHRKLVNSYGGNISGMESGTVKSFTTAFDSERGIPHLEKKAEFPLTLEILKDSAGSALDMNKVVRKLLSSQSFTPMFKWNDFESKDGDLISMQGRFDTKEELLAAFADAKDPLAEMELMLEQPAYANIVETEGGKLRPVIENVALDLNGTYENMQEIVDELKMDYTFIHPVTGLESDIWDAIIEIEETNPQVIGMYGEKVGLATSVKAGLHSVNQDLQSDAILNTSDDYKVKLVPIGNENHGIQLNPDHDPYHAINAVSMPTQKYSAYALEGKNPKLVDNIYGAIAQLGEYKVARDINPRNLKEIAKEIVIKDAKKGDKIDNTLRKFLDEDWDLNDPMLYRQVQAKVSAYYGSVGIRHKMTGGQYVVTATSQFNQVYDVKWEGNEYVMSRSDLDKFMSSKQILNIEQAKELGVITEPRDLKYPEYFKADGTPLSDHESFQDLQALWGKLTVAEVNKYAEKYALKPFNKELLKEDKKALLKFQEQVRNEAHDAYSEEINEGGYTATHAEVFLPSTFKKQFTTSSYDPFGAGTHIWEVQENELFFLELAQRKLGYKKQEIDIEDSVERRQSIITAGKYTSEQIGIQTTILNDLLVVAAREPNNVSIQADIRNTKLKIKDLQKESRDLHKLLFKDSKRKEEWGDEMELIPVLSIESALKERLQNRSEVEEHARELRNSFLKLLEGDAARIPGTGKQSASPIKVVGFHDSLGNSIGISPMSMVVKGEDLDIDKAYVQLFEPIESGRYSGIVVPHFAVVNGMVVKDSTEGRVATLQEILDSEHGAKFQEYIDNSHNQDIYDASVKNYIVQGGNTLMSDGKNAIESYTSVSIDTINDFIDRNKDTLQKDQNFAPWSPVVKDLLASQNKIGAKMIGIFATALKGYEAMYQSAKGLELDGKEPTMGFHDIEFGMLGDRTRYSKVANTTSSDIKNQAWKFLSELVNAATDNAKLLVLAKINTNEHTSNTANFLISMGVPFEQVLDFLNHQYVKDYFDLKQKNRVLSKRGLKSEITTNKEILKKLNKDIHRVWGIDLTGDATKVVIDGVEINNSFDKKADKFVNMANALGINQGMPSSSVDMFMFNRRLSEFFSGMPKDFKLSDLTVESLREQDFGSDPLNPGNILKYNQHYFGMLQLFDRLYNEFDSENKIIGTVNRVMKRLDRGKFDGHVAKKYEHAEKIVNKVYIAEYLQGKKAMLNKPYDLDTAKDRSQFVDAFTDFIENTIRDEFANNLFISKLRQSNRKGLDGTKVQAYSVRGMKNMEEAEIFDLKMSMEKLSEPIQQSLYYYDLIMNGGQGMHSYNGLFDIEVARPLMEFSTKYDLNRISTKSLSDYVDFTFTDDYNAGTEEDAEYNPDRKYRIIQSEDDYYQRTFKFQGDDIMYLRSNGLRYSNIPNTSVGIPFEVINGTVLSNELYTRDRAAANAGSIIAGYYENSRGVDPLTRLTIRDTKTAAKVRYTSRYPDIHNPDNKFTFITSVDQISKLTEGGFYKYTFGKSKKGKTPKKAEYKIDGVLFEVDAVGKFDDKGTPIGKGSKYIIPLSMYIENKKFFTHASLKDDNIVIPYEDNWAIEGFTSDVTASTGRLKGKIVIDEDNIPHDMIGEILSDSLSKDIEIVSKRYRTPAEYVPYVSENPNSLIKNGVDVMGFNVDKAMPMILADALPQLNSILPHDIEVITSLDMDEMELPVDLKSKPAFMYKDKAYINRELLHLNDSAAKLLPALIGDKLYILDEFSNLQEDIIEEQGISEMDLFINTLTRDIVSEYVAEDSEESRSLLGATNEALNSIEEYLGIIPDATIGSVLSSLTKNNGHKISEKFEAIENAEAKLQKEIDRVKKLNNIKENKDC